MKILQLIFAGTVALMSQTAVGQTATKLSATKANDFGLAYSLPRTAVDVTLQAQCVVRKPGVFYNYAERYLGRDAARNAVKEASTTWTLTGADMGVTAYVAEGSEQYLMQFKNGNAVYVMVDANGAPLAINTEDVEAVEAKPSQLTASPLTASPLDGPAARYAVTEEMVASSSAAKRAQLAAEQIMQLRQSRQDYLTGQADVMPDGKALEMILANINAQEEALTAMFLGTEQTLTEVVTKHYVPAADYSQSDVVIARLNPVTGFVDPDDLSGAPIYLQYTVTRRGELPRTEKGELKKFPKGGVPYCIPGEAAISLDYEGKVMLNETLEVAQLGVVYGLDPAFFTDKKAPGYVTFDPLTGALRKVATK